MKRLIAVFILAIFAGVLSVGSVLAGAGSDSPYIKVEHPSVVSPTEDIPLSVTLTNPLNYEMEFTGYIEVKYYAVNGSNPVQHDGTVYWMDCNQDNCKFFWRVKLPAQGKGTFRSTFKNQGREGDFDLVQAFFMLPLQDPEHRSLMSRISVRKPVTPTATTIPQTATAAATKTPIATATPTAQNTRPVIDSVSPIKARPGETVIIQGKNLLGPYTNLRTLWIFLALDSGGADTFYDGLVDYKGNVRPGLEWHETYIHFKVPEDRIPKSGKLYITVDNLWAVAPERFEILSKQSVPPTLTPSLTPVRTETPVPNRYVKITYPNGGESFNIGNNGARTRVTWESRDVDWCYLGWTTGPGSLNNFATIPNASVGYYDWNISVGNMLNGMSREVKLDLLCYKTGIGSVLDQSDRFFTVFRNDQGNALLRMTSTVTPTVTPRR